MSKLTWGSPEWRTHLRRSLAQRKRHGEHIDDIDGLINYIEAKGPAKANETMKPRTDTRKPQPRQRTNKIVNNRGQKIVSAPIGQTVGSDNGLFKAPVVLRGR